MLEQRRGSDKGVLCKLARYLSLGWDFIDKRDIDRRMVSLMILWGTVEITKWSMNFAAYTEKTGLEVAALIAAINVPYMALQAAAIGFFFKTK